MAQNQVHDDVQPSFVSFLEQVFKILQIAKFRVDGVVIRNVIAKIDIGGGVDRRHPDAIHPQVSQVVKVLDDAWQVTDAVPVGILKGTRIDLIDDPILPPKSVVCQPDLLVVLYVFDSKYFVYFT